MKAVVTGANGFVGRHLVSHLQSAGDEVVGLDREVDIVDAAAIREAVCAAAADVVYHLAALPHVGASWDAPGLVMRVNVEGTANVVRAAEAAGAARIIVVGSAEEYGLVDPNDLPLAESAPLRPTTPYGASKVAAGFLALQAHLGRGTPTIRVRSFNHAGPGQSNQFLLPALAARIATAERTGDDAVAIGSLDPVRDITDVRDVVRAYRLLGVAGSPGEVYNVCSGVGRSVGELAAGLIAAATRPLELSVDPQLVRAVDTPRLVGDCSKLTAATGWTPEIPLDQTMTDLLAEARSRLEQ